MGPRTSTYERVNDDHEFDSILPSHNQSGSRAYFTESFDSFTLIWLDIQSKGNNLESLKTKNLLLEISRDCLFYDNCYSFFQDIDAEKFKDRKILLIVSGALVGELLSRSNQTQTSENQTNIKDIIRAVIIFCAYAHKYMHLKKDFIVDVCTDRASLENSILSEMSSLKVNLFENQPLRSVQSLTKDNVSNGIYFKYLLFIELSKQMPQTKESKETMLKQSENYYRAHDKRLKEINEFRQCYTPDKALQWYTHDGFLYRLVNSATRTDEITLWHVFRYYITGLCAQLEKIYQNQEEKFGPRRLKLYRGQSRMSKKEFKNIQSRVGSLVATTGFFSTSLDHKVAMEFMAGASLTDDNVPVFYEILVDTSITKNIVFAEVDKYLSSHNEQAGEQEVLFNIGSIFKITNVYPSENFWNIRMEGTDDGISSVKEQIKSIVEKFDLDNMNLLYGKHILNMGYYSAADAYFQRMLEELPKGHKHVALVYDSIGDMKMRVTNWNEALVNFNQANMLKKKYRPKNHPDFGVTFNHLGNYYRAIGDNTSALSSYRKSLKCVKDSFNKAVTQLNIASILIKNGQYSQALELCRDVFCQLQQIEPFPNAQMVVCQCLMGDIYFAQDNYDDAQAFYLNAFTIAKRYLFIDDRCLIKCIDSLATIYEKQDQNNNQRVVDFCQEQLSLCQRDLPENHVGIAHILMICGKFSDTINHYEKALTIFERNISEAYAPTANCLMLMAKYYDQSESYEKAHSFYSRAYEIQQKIYPKTHSLIMDNQQLIDSAMEKLKTQPTKR